MVHRYMLVNPLFHTISMGHGFNSKLLNYQRVTVGLPHLVFTTPVGKAQALPSLIDIFQELDSDGSGLLTHQEVDNVPLEILPPRVLDSVYVDGMRDIFDLFGCE